MRKNCFIVGEELASFVTCILSTVNGQCFRRKSMLNKVHTQCWDNYVAEQRKLKPSYENQS